MHESRTREDEAGRPVSRRRILLAGAQGVAGAALWSGVAAASDEAAIARAFEDPYLELIRLLHEAAEIEHDLMVQYLYGAFSLKPAYAEAVGAAIPETEHFLGVAIQEMQHLRSVNALLAALGVKPVLTRQDFPYEVDIYPFPFQLEPLSRASLARYVYCEAGRGAFAPAAAHDEAERAFRARVASELGAAAPPNQVGTLYDAVIARLKEHAATGKGPQPGLGDWLPKLEAIKAEGEVGHFTFFRSLLMGTQASLARRGDVWALPITHADYPSYEVPLNPTAYPGRPNSIRDETARALAWLGNLSYWASLVLVQMSYDGQSDGAAQMGQEIMLGPMWSLSRALPARGAALPFDPLSMGFDPGRDAANQERILLELLGEAGRLAERLGPDLPTDFDPAAFATYAERIREGEI